MSHRREFMILFEESRLTQRRLAALLGVAVTTVNRWFVDRNDSFEPPAYALQFLRAFAMLPAQARERFPEYKKPTAPAEAGKEKATDGRVPYAGKDDSERGPYRLDITKKD